MIRLLLIALPLAFFAVFYFYPMAAIVGISLTPAMLETLAESNTWQGVGFTF